MLTPSEHARLVRAELEAIVAALRVDELTQLVVFGRKLLDQDGEGAERQVSDRRSSDDMR